MRGMGSDSRGPGLVCALRERRFGTAEALAEHAFGPHFRSNRPGERFASRPASVA